MLSPHRGCRRRRCTRVSAVAGALACVAALSAQSPSPTSDAAQRAAERVRSLRAEADALLDQEQSVLGRLRRLEADRAARVEQVRALDHEASGIEQDLHVTETHLSALERAQAEQAPLLRERLVELYKLGAPGYARLLAGVDNLRDMGRAYRAVSALAALDRERVRAHTSTVASLRRARDELSARRTALAAVRAQQERARAGADAAVRAHAALVADIDQRRDLNAQLTSELVAAQQKLEQQLASGHGADGALPIAPFKGTLDWPVDGRVIRRFAPPLHMIGATPRPGVDIATAPSAPVAAVHEGLVAYAAPFAGFGNLVIVDHGGKAFSVYGYLGRVDVTKGSRIATGQVLGASGTSPAGRDALYFEMRIDGRAVDPLQWLKARP